MNSINLHNVKLVEFGNIKYLENCNSYSLSIIVHHRISYIENENIESCFEITMFSLKREILEQFKCNF